MARIIQSIYSDAQNRRWTFFCPGCQSKHTISEKTHHFNGDVDYPTLSPSVIYNAEGYRCHFYISDGHIQYLTDCTHIMAGQTLDLPNIDNE